MWLVVNFISFPFTIWYIKSLRSDMTRGSTMSPRAHAFGLASLVLCLVSTIKLLG